MTFRHRSKPEMLDWLRTHVRLQDDCRIWAGYTNSAGYPIICWLPRGDRIPARSLMLELLGRKMPPRPVTWSTCGNRLCMEPAHLMVGTRADMVRWISAERRYSTGPARSVAIAIGRAPNARMGMSHARVIAQAIASGSTHQAIAAEYNVDPSAVGHALRRWRAAGVI